MAHPARILTADEGNSSIKLVLFEDDIPVRKNVVEGADASVLQSIRREAKAGGAILSSTARDSDAWRAELKGDWMVVDHRFDFPVDIRYDSPHTLGLDRIAAAAGAFRLYGDRNILVADLGTALTLDIVAGGRFIGGNISPGMTMRFDSLHREAARLPKVSANGELPEFGHDTETAIRCGVVNGIIAEIIYAMQSARRAYDCDLLLLTGGAMDRSLAALLAMKAGEQGIYDEIKPEPLLVSYGLLSIYRNNE